MKSNSLNFIYEQLYNNKIMCIGEAHCYPKIIEKQIQIICNEKLDTTFTDLILESGTTEDQIIINQFINSKVNLSNQELINITLKSSSFMGALGPHIPTFFKKLRRCNKRRMKKSLNPIVIHFPEIKTSLDHHSINNKLRDKMYFEYFHKHNLIAKKGIIIYMGAYHLIKDEHFLGGMLNKKYPKKIVVIWPHLNDRIKYSSISINLYFEYFKNKHCTNMIFNTKHLPFSLLSINDLFYKINLSGNIKDYIDGYWYLGDYNREINNAFLTKYNLKEKFNFNLLIEKHIKK